MMPSLEIALAVAGSLALAASLFLKKRAGWIALVATGLLAPLAVQEADPVLALGILVLVAARFARCHSPDAGAGLAPKAGPNSGTSNQHP